MPTLQQKAVAQHDTQPMTDMQERPRILVIDDPTCNREILVQNLEDEYDLLVTSDGLAGVNAARDQQPDIILLDLWMSTHGWETARQLRRNPETAWIPIVAVTAHAMAGTEERALQCGRDDYLANPVDEQLLLVKVREWIALGRLRRKPWAYCLAACTGAGIASTNPITDLSRPSSPAVAKSVPAM